MPTAQISTYANVGGLGMQGIQQRTATGQISHEVSLAAGKAGTLTTRTDDDTGEATLGAGHGLVLNDVVDVYWAGGVRYGMVVGVVVGTVVPIDTGAGDVLPAQSTALIICKVTVIDTDFDGDLLDLIAALSDRRAHLTFLDVGDAVLEAVELLAGELWSWASATGITNPLTGNPVDEIHASNGQADYAATLKIGALYDSEA